MDNAYKLAKQWVGKTLDVDGVFGGQCVDVPNWIAQQYGTYLLGNGNQIGIANDVSAFADVIPWREDLKLQTGDIISQDVPSHGYGHVVVFGEGSYDNALVIEQNYNWEQVTVEHRRSLRSEIPLRVVRFRNQDGYVPDGGDSSSSGNNSNNKNNGGSSTPAEKGTLYEITCDIVDGVKGSGDNTRLDTFFKCNKVTGSVNGEYLIYKRYDGSVGYLPMTCVKPVSSEDTGAKEKADYIAINEYNKYNDITQDGISQEQKIYSLGELINQGGIVWENYNWGYMFKAQLPNDGKDVKGLGLSAHGFVVDGDGYIVMAYPTTYGDIRGRTYNTPFGYKGKAYYPLSDINDFKVFIK